MSDHLLIVTGTPGEREKLHAMLADSPDVGAVMIDTSSGSDSLAATSDGVDCVIVAEHLPEMSGVEFLQRAGFNANVAVVMIIDSDEVPDGALRSGAHAYLVRGTFDAARLIHTIDSAREKAEAMREELDRDDHMFLFYSLLDESEDLLIVVDVSRERVVKLNNAARRALQIDEDVDLSEKLRASEIFSATPTLWNKLRVQTATMHSGHADTDLITGAGRRYPVEIRSRRLEVGGNDFLVAVVRDISDRKQLERELLRSANHDELTGLPNGTALLDMVRQFWLQALSENDCFAVFSFELDNIAAIREAVGPEQTDALIKRVAATLELTLRRCNEYLACVDGPRFGASGYNLDSGLFMSSIERTRNAVRKAAIPDPTGGSLSISMGACLHRAEGSQKLRSLIAESESLLEQALKEGPDALRFMDHSGGRAANDDS